MRRYDLRLGTAPAVGGSSVDGAAAVRSAGPRARLVGKRRQAETPEAWSTLQGKANMSKLFAVISIKAQDPEFHDVALYRAENEEQVWKQLEVEYQMTRAQIDDGDDFYISIRQIEEPTQL